MIPGPVSVVPLDAAAVAAALLVALGAGAILSLLHRFALHERIVPGALSMALVLLSFGGAFVTLLIGESLARAFSLAGALAVVRFRTRMDNPLDLAFVFLVMGAGMGAGTFAWSVVGIGLAIVVLTVLALGSVIRSRGDVHLVRVDLVAHSSRAELLDAVLDKHVRTRSLEQARSLRFGETLSLWYRVALRGQGVEDLIRELSALEGVERVVALVGEDAGNAE